MTQTRSGATARPRPQTTSNPRARRSATGLVIHRIILGRCLLALQATGRYQDFGSVAPSTMLSACWE
ncbi:MAG: hypothetical protein AB7S38_29295 [Vulcanimicrobiota bacterium]